MRKTMTGVAVAFAALMSLAPMAQAQTLNLDGIKLPTAEENAKMPVPEVATPAPHIGIAVDVPGAKELPDPKLIYKVVFDLAPAAKTPGEINPGLLTVGRFVNTLAKYGVPQDHRKFIVVFHRGSTPAILTNEEYKKRNNGVDNPNIKIMEQLKAAGVDFRVCGQAVLGMKIDHKTILPEIQVDLWAGMTIPNMMMRGYQRLGD